MTTPADKQRAYRDTNDEAQTKRQALAELFAIVDAANDAMDRIAKYTGRVLLDQMNDAEEYGEPHNDDPG